MIFFRFLRAVANNGSRSLTAPYLDPLGAGFILSISQSLNTSYGKKNIFGVIGADLTVSNFGARLRKTIGKKCLDSENKLRCFIVDSNGYVVYHPNFDDAYNDSSKVLNKHITETDSGIAGDMIKSKVMVRRECQNFNVLQLQRFYEVTPQYTNLTRNKIFIRSGRKDGAVVRVLASQQCDPGSIPARGPFVEAPKTIFFLPGRLSQNLKPYDYRAVLFTHS